MAIIRSFRDLEVYKLALACEYMTKEKHDELDDKYNHICAQLHKMMDKPEQWCRGTG